MRAIPTILTTPNTAATAPTGTPGSAPLALGPGQGQSIQFGPCEHLLFRATAATTGGQFSLFEITAQPVTGPPEHVHSDHDQTYYVLEGTFDVKVGERRLTATVGTCVFIPRGTAHTFRNVDQRRSRMLVLATPGGIERFFEELRPHMWTRLDPHDLRPLLRKHDVEIVGPPLTHLSTR